MVSAFIVGSSRMMKRQSHARGYSQEHEYGEEHILCTHTNIYMKRKMREEKGKRLAFLDVQSNTLYSIWTLLDVFYSFISTLCTAQAHTLRGFFSAMCVFHHHHPSSFHHDHEAKFYFCFYFFRHIFVTAILIIIFVVLSLLRHFILLFVSATAK